MEQIEVNSFGEYIEVTEKYKGNFLFRGQANKQWEIKPSLFRSDGLINQEAVSIKSSAYYDESNILSSMFKIQHYGGKTRLIDLTNSPYSALFFSCDGEEHFSEDGAVYLFLCDENVNFQDEDLIRFANYVVDDAITDIQISEDTAKLLTQDRIVSYDHKFSYSNKRALLQGGTALVTGFAIIDDKLMRHKDVDFRSKAIVTIIIPAEIKNDILLTLRKQGYCHEILYDTFDNSNKLMQTSLIPVEENLTKKADFNKVVAFYRVEDLFYCKENLINLIESEYIKYFLKNGDQARIWMYIYYDEEDKRNGNWKCRTSWNEESKYCIHWAKEYFEKRLSRVNEEYSEQEVLEKIRKTVKIIYSIHDTMKVVYEQYGLVKFTHVAIKYKGELINSNWVIANIPFTSISLDDYINKTMIYVSDVEQLATDVSYYTELGENENFLNHMVETLLKKCKQSKSEQIEAKNILINSEKI